MKKWTIFIAMLLCIGMALPAWALESAKPLLKIPPEFQSERLILTMPDGSKKDNNQIMLEGPQDTPIYALEDALVIGITAQPDDLRYRSVELYFEDETVVTLGGNISFDYEIGAKLTAGAVLAKVGGGTERGIPHISASAKKHLAKEPVDPAPRLEFVAQKK